MFFTKKSSRKQQLEEALKSQSIETHETKVFKALKRSGKYGIWNYELAGLCIDWHRRIGDLRSQGVSISSVRQKDGGWKYYLNKE